MFDCSAVFLAVQLTVVVRLNCWQNWEVDLKYFGSYFFSRESRGSSYKNIFKYESDLRVGIVIMFWVGKSPFYDCSGGNKIEKKTKHGSGIHFSSRKSTEPVNTTVSEKNDSYTVLLYNTLIKMRRQMNHSLSQYFCNITSTKFLLWVRLIHEK